MRANSRFDIMTEINLQKDAVYSSLDDIQFIDQQSSLTFKCPICHRIFRDPIITQCGVSYLFYSILIFHLFNFTSTHSVESVFLHQVGN